MLVDYFNGIDVGVRWRFTLSQRLEFPNIFQCANDLVRVDTFGRRRREL